MNRTPHELAAIPIPGGWTWQTIELEGQRWRLLLPADGEAFLAEEATAERWPDPFWTEIWPAAQSLAAMVLNHDWLANTSVLELGCGNGFVGLAALARGCRVTFSDYVPLAVELAVANARGNGYVQARGEVLDWRHPTADTQYDTILAADVLYDPDLHEPLLNTLQARLASGGVAWLADPGRGECAEMFVQIAKQNWEIKLFDVQNVPRETLARGEFRLFQLRRMR